MCRPVVPRPCQSQAPPSAQALQRLASRESLDLPHAGSWEDSTEKSSKYEKPYIIISICIYIAHSPEIQINALYNKICIKNYKKNIHVILF